MTMHTRPLQTLNLLAIAGVLAMVRTWCHWQASVPMAALVNGLPFGAALMALRAGYRRADLWAATPKP